MSTERAARTEETPYKIRDLVEKTGITKETIHFYITEGLLPKAHKTARNMAWYGESHVERLKTIKELQEKQFLPLRAIKAVLGNDSDYDFTDDQRRTIASIQSRLGGGDAGGARRYLTYRELGARYGVKPFELDELEGVGVLTVDRSGRSPRVDAADEELLRVWADLRAIGYAPERGFGPRDLEVFARLIDALFDHELKLVMNRIGSLDGDEAARMVEQGVPRINEMLALLHARRVRRFLSEFDERK